MLVMLDGRPVEPEDASISVYDWGLLRGDGCFESIRVYGGKPFAAAEHLDRLETSARLMDIGLPERHLLEKWVETVAADGGDCAVRVVVTRGSIEPQVSGPTRCIVMSESLPHLPDAFRLLPVRAPWHAGGDPSELTGAKTLSYAPNVAASRRAQAAGFDDAVLVSREGWVLEGPTFGIGWFYGETLETPSLDLGILKSITRTGVLLLAERLGIPVQEGRFPLERMTGADEVLAMSTIKEVAPVRMIGEHTLAPGPATARLAAAFRQHVLSRLGG